MKNKEVAAILYHMAELLELKGENHFKVIAFSKAARALEGMKEDVGAVAARGDLKSIPGVGKAIAAKVAEYLQTGEIGSYNELLSSIPAGLTELLQVPGLGPKTVMLLSEKLGVSDLDGLEEAARRHQIRRLPRMGATSEARILRSLERYRKRSSRIPLGIAQPLVEQMVGYLDGIEGLDHVTPAGSFRRGRETVGDIDILATSSRPADAIASFVKMPLVDDVLVKGPTKASVIVKETIQVDLRIVDHRSYGTILQYFTGSKEHNVKLRGIALQKGYSLSEYSLTRLAGGEEEYFEREDDLYARLGMQYIPPELREDEGEIEAALRGEIPSLVETSDILGDLHVHSSWSDGRGGIVEMAAAAKARGYSYIGLCDHSPSVGIAGGLSPKRLREKIEAVHKANESLDGIVVLAGTEVDIRADGSLDYPDSLLAECDVVVAAIHMAQDQKAREINGRLMRAIGNEHVDIIAHPTGRIIGKRDPYDVDMQAVLEAAAEAGTIMEVNAHPSRLDLSDCWCRAAKGLGVKVAINSDAHSPEGLDVMPFGVLTARRGWLERGDVANALPLEDLMRLFR